MRTFKHKNTGEVLVLNASHSALSVVENSPSWEETTEETVESTPVDSEEVAGAEEVVEDTKVDPMDEKAEETTEEVVEGTPTTKKKK